MTDIAFRKIPINKPSISEREISYVHDAIRYGWGERCYDYIYKFEDAFSKYLDTKHALATSSCTGAIHLALLALGVKAGDEVIVPEITWIASVEPVLYIGAKPVFVDVTKDDWCIDIEKLKQAITPKTKAIIVVHIYGNACPMDEIMNVAAENNLVVVEDAAEGLGSEYKDRKLGSIGHAGVFSFHGTKTLSTGEGGMLVTNDSVLYERAKILNDHGRNPQDNKTFWMREYGYKYKMSNLQAAMGLAQTERIEELVEKKRVIFSWYKHFLKGVPGGLNPEVIGTRNSYWLPTIVFDKELNFSRESFFHYMKAHNIDSRPFFYPLSSLPMFETVKSNTVAYDIYERAVNLPSFHDITKDEVRFVSDTIIKFLSQQRG